MYATVKREDLWFRYELSCHLLLDCGSESSGFASADDTASDEVDDLGESPLVESGKIFVAQIRSLDVFENRFELLPRCWVGAVLDSATATVTTMNVKPRPHVNTVIC